jgi:hypothetical protein
MARPLCYLEQQSSLSLRGGHKPIASEIGVTFKCSAACFGWPHSSNMASSAFLLSWIDTNTCDM